MSTSNNQESRNHHPLTTSVRTSSSTSSPASSSPIWACFFSLVHISIQAYVRTYMCVYTHYIQSVNCYQCSKLHLVILEPGNRPREGWMPKWEIMLNSIFITICFSMTFLFYLYFLYSVAKGKAMG